MGRRQMHVGYWWENLEERKKEDKDVSGWIMLK
jgi:hypothetical protein